MVPTSRCSLPHRPRFAFKQSSLPLLGPHPHELHKLLSGVSRSVSQLARRPDTVIHHNDHPSHPLHHLSFTIRGAQLFVLVPFRFIRLCGRRYLQQSQTTGSVALAPTMGSSKTLTNISSFDVSFYQCSFRILCNLSMSGASSGGLGLAVFLNPLQLAVNRKEDVQCFRLLL